MEPAVRRFTGLPARRRRTRPDRSVGPLVLRPRDHPDRLRAAHSRQATDPASDRDVPASKCQAFAGSQVFSAGVRRGQFGKRQPAAVDDELHRADGKAAANEFGEIAARDDTGPTTAGPPMMSKVLNWLLIRGPRPSARFIWASRRWWQVEGPRIENVRDSPSQNLALPPARQRRHCFRHGGDHAIDNSTFETTGHQNIGTILPVNNPQDTLPELRDRPERAGQRGMGPGWSSQVNEW